ncbi:MAG: hypothetical protein ACYDEQ_08270 [Desulfocucumaceae bacterium]
MSGDIQAILAAVVFLLSHAVIISEKIHRTVYQLEGHYASI